MLSEKQVEQYQEEGYVVTDFRLSANDLEDIKAAHARLIERHEEFRNYCANILAFDLAFLNWARIPTILDMVEQILGKNFALWNSSFFAKPPLDGHETPWHQDSEYWPIRPMATCTAWLAIDDSNIENGCLKVVPKSHKSKRAMAHKKNDRTDLTLNQEILGSECDLSNPAFIELEAGQVSLHDAFLVHGSDPNRSNWSRRGMTLRYMPTTSVYDRNMANEMSQGKEMVFNHKNRTLFLMRGGDPSGKNDFRMRN